MLEQEVTIINKLGLHARASSKLTQTASRFQSEVWISRNNKRVNAKSIMGVMMLAVAKGAQVKIDTTGIDEAEALQAVLTLIQERFGESE